MGDFGVFTTSYWRHLRVPVKYFRGALVLIGEGRKRRNWKVIDRYFDKHERLYVHRIVQA